MTKNKISFDVLISIFNTLILSFYIFTFDLSYKSIFLDIILLLTFLSLISIFQKKFKNIFLDFICKFQVTIFLIIILVFLLEILYFINPNIIPNLNLWIDRDDKKTSVIEYLKSSPFVKFKPNVVVRITSQFTSQFRGTADQFKYTWKTDFRGFKNQDAIANLSEFNAIAIGDSFTEGMGVAVEDTFPSILSSKGFSTYNLGVQGYSPSQMKGSLEKYGIDLKPKFIIMTYTMGTYERENFFIGKNFISKQKYPGGIGTIVKGQTNNEIRKQAKYVISGVWLMTNSIFVRDILKRKWKYKSINLVDNKFDRYKHLISVKDLNTSPKDLNAWKYTLDTFKEVNLIAKNIGAKLVLVYVTKRPVIYYERATGKKIPKDVLNETKLLKEFSKINDIIYIDPAEKLINYVNNLDENFNIKSLPFLEIDAHMNKIGYTFFANTIIKALN